ncbi:MAG: hypothetical protein JWQ11_1924 [Rhizobacter sp.]|nr:hypothetical protein [Rhizobacter sp.]
MGIFSNILHKIFPANHPAVLSEASPNATAAPVPAVPEASAQAAPTAPAPAMPEVDVEAILTEMASKSGQSLNWRTSIVDLMKLLQLDSDLGSRQALAKELNYSGDPNETATMNVWLHKQVMTKLAANGGKVPADLKD